MNNNYIVSEPIKIIVCIFAKRRRRVFAKKEVCELFRDSIIPVLAERGCTEISVRYIPIAQYAVLVEMKMPSNLSVKEVITVIKKAGGHPLMAQFREFSKMRSMWSSQAWACTGDMDNGKWDELFQFLGGNDKISAD